MRERFRAGLRMSDEPQPACGVVEEYGRRVMLAGLYLEFAGGLGRRGAVAVKREKVLVERVDVFRQHFLRVVPRIDGDEEALDVCAVRAEQPHGPPERRQGERADVRTARIAEIQRDHLAAEI